MNYYFGFILLIIVLILFYFINHPYSIFFFKNRLLNYKTEFEKNKFWKIDINPEIKGEILYFLQKHGYKEIDYFENDMSLIKYVFPKNKIISKDYHFLFVFWNKNEIAIVVSVILLNDNIWYIDHMAINQLFRKKNYQTEALIYIYQFFYKKDKSKNPQFLIQKAGKPSRFFIPFNFKTTYSLINWDELNNLEKLVNCENRYFIKNENIKNEKLKECFFMKLNGLNTYWFSYPLKIKKQKRRYELVYFENENNNIKTENQLLKCNDIKNSEFLIPSMDFKNQIYRFWYIYPFFNEGLFQKDNVFIELV